MTSPGTETGLKRFLPRINSPAYHLMLAAVAIFVLGPLGGISAAFMNFSIGFFIGGQVLAGILGSTVTLRYGPEGKHGANYMQTLAASVAGMCGMAVLIQARDWLALPEVPVWQLILYFVCIGMFGVGVGMLYTPMSSIGCSWRFRPDSPWPIFCAHSPIKNLLRRSIAKLGGGMFLGYVGGVAGMKVAAIESLGISTSTFGAGMIVGARIALPALVVALVGDWLKPYLVSIHWLEGASPDGPQTRSARSVLSSHSE